MTKTYLISDTHLNHQLIATYCDRPRNFTDLIQLAWNRTVKPEDVVIHLGDVAIGDKKQIGDAVKKLAGRKILIRGNHDRGHSNTWWMTKGGFDFSCDSMTFRNCLLTHEPYQNELPPGIELNIHGHLHNIWHTPHRNESVDAVVEHNIKASGILTFPYQRLFVVEYTSYSPVEFDKFVSRPDKYFSRGVSTWQI